jgi:methyl-accepting chemotaxis protein
MAERGDLRQRVDIHTNDETGLLAARFQHMVDSQRSLLGALQQSVAGVAEVIDAISRAGGTVGKGANTIESQVQATAEAMRNMQRVIEGVGANVEELRQSSDRSTDAITQMVTANETVADNVGVMAENVDQSANAIDQMAGHVQRVASSITELDRAVVSTGESMTEIQRSIDAVQESARITAQLSARALADAEAGGTALQDTITSMERIRATATQAFSVLAALGQSMRDIGGIVELINDLAHKTNLLALNAGIIASHAGEHGAAFNVVAAEIKTLADRTRSSTAEITAVIGRIQVESQGASAAMQAGMLSVDDGARVGVDAAAKLTHIQASARESSLRVAAIARATQDEAHQTRSVAEAFERIGRNLQRLSTTAQEQARDSQRMRNTTKDINVLTQAVKRSSQEQAVGSRQVIEAMGEIHHVVKQVQDAQGQQSSAARAALLAVEEIRRVSAQQNDSVQRLENVIDVLRRQTLELQGVMARFKT